MARTRTRADKVASAYFGEIDPLWVQPGKASIPERYHPGSSSLADWAASLPGSKPEDWSDNDKTGYFVIRHYWVHACECWRVYDWERDIRGNRALLDAQKAASSLLKATAQFTLALDGAKISHAWEGLGLDIALALDEHRSTQLKDPHRTEAIKQGFDTFERRLNGLADRTYRFGPLHYRKSPPKVSEATALAIVLADIVTECRRDGARYRRGQQPSRVARISKNTPWKAVAEFVRAALGETAEDFDALNIKTRVESHLRSVWQIDLFPNG